MVRQMGEVPIARDSFPTSHGIIFSPRLVSCESSRFGLSVAIFPIIVFLFSVTRMWRTTSKPSTCPG